MKGVSAQLEIKVSGRSVVARLEFRNGATQDAFLEKSKVFADGTITNDLFVVRCEGRDVPYLGTMEKLPAPGPEDFLPLAPGKSYQASVNLKDTYEFLPGAHLYEIRYDAIHTTVDGKGVWALKSNEASFTLRR